MEEAQQWFYEALQIIQKFAVDAGRLADECEKHCSDEISQKWRLMKSSELKRIAITGSKCLGQLLDAHMHIHKCGLQTQSQHMRQQILRFKVALSDIEKLIRIVEDLTCSIQELKKMDSVFESVVA